MYKELVFLCCAISLISISTTEAKGGRGGRSSGKSSSRGSSGGFFSSVSSGKSSSGSGGFFSSSGSVKSSSIGGKSGNSFSGGWFHGFFHNTPYRYTYRPSRIVHISSSSSNTGSYHTANQEEEAEQEKENSDFVIGYSISKALSSDFFSIFNVVHDVAKYPEKIRNKELLTTTTHSPVAPYDSYTKTDTNYGLDTKSYYPDDDNLFDMVYSKKDLENNDEIQESFGNFEKVFEVTSTESPPKKVETKSYSAADGSFIDWIRSKNDFGINESIQKKLAEIQSNMARNGFQVASTESTTTKIDTTSYSPDANSLFGRTESKNRLGFDDSIMKQLAEMQSSIVRNDWKLKASLDASNESFDEMLKRMQDSHRSLRLFP